MNQQHKVCHRREKLLFNYLFHKLTQVKCVSSSKDTSKVVVTSCNIFLFNLPTCNLNDCNTVSNSIE